MTSRPFIFFCTHANCKAKYNRKDRLEVHLRTHTGERPFVCSYDDCDKSYARFQNLKRHEAFHEHGRLECPHEDCDIILKTQATLKKHLNVYHVKKANSFKCSQCDRKFAKQSLLKYHENKHNNHKPYKCSHEGCVQAFPTPSKLARHLKVHKGYKCGKEGCEEISATWSLHLKHVKVVHANIYKCHWCSKVFSKAYNLKKHEGTHIGFEDRKCLICPEPNCSRFYFDIKNLRQHIRKNHEGPFKCKEESCSLSFPTTESQERHHKKVHNTDVPLSSKKRKLKSKKKKRIKLSLAAKLAGFTKEEGIAFMHAQHKIKSESTPIKAEPQCISNEAEPKCTSNKAECASNETESNCKKPDDSVTILPAENVQRKDPVLLCLNGNSTQFEDKCQITFRTGKSESVIISTILC